MSDMNDLQLTIIELGAIRTNCYFLGNKKTGEAIIVDPAENFLKIRSKLENKGLSPVAVFLTHGHFDHIAAADDAREAYNIPVYCGKAEKELLSDAALNGSVRFTRKNIATSADRWLSDGDELNIAGFDIKIIETPGHTAGSVCFYFKNENVLISGDTLFKDDYGRTDFPTGDFATIAESIKTKLFTLPEATVVYPGHGVKTTIGYEKTHNSIL